MFNGLQDQGLRNDKTRLVEEVAEQIKIDKAPPNLKNVERKQLKSKSDEINRVLNYIVTESITTTSQLLEEAGCVVAKELGFKTKLAKLQEPRCKKRIKDKINSLTKNLSHLDQWSKAELHNEATKDKLGNRYKVKDKELKLVIEELKQRLVTTSSTLNRHEARAEPYVQNKMFQTNQVKLFERLEKENTSNDVRPGTQKSVRFWSRIWVQPVTHNDEVKWLKKVERQLRGTTKQENITITTDKLKKQLR